MKFALLLLSLFLNCNFAICQTNNDLAEITSKLKIAKDELTALKSKSVSDQKAYNDTLARIRAERENLLSSISSCNSPIPDFITLNKIKPIDTEIGVVLTTNRYGRLKVVLRDQSHQVRESRETDFDSKHL